MSISIGTEANTGWVWLSPRAEKQAMEKGLVGLNEIAMRLDLSPGQVKKLAGRIGLCPAKVNKTKPKFVYEKEAAEAACQRFLELKAGLAEKGLFRMGKKWGAAFVMRMLQQRERSSAGSVVKHSIPEDF